MPKLNPVELIVPPRPVSPPEIASGAALERLSRLTDRPRVMLVPSTGAAQRAAERIEGAVDPQTRQTTGTAERAVRFAPARTVVLVGLMGAGKTKIGRRLAARLELPFYDSDIEIETAAGETIEEIFRNRGEAVFRDGERRVIKRLLDRPVHVLATGGGSFMDPETRAAIIRRGVSVWLRAPLDVLLARVLRRGNRPLLQERDPRAVLAELIERRHPVYAQADLTVGSAAGPPETTTSQVIAALAACPRAALPPEPESCQ